MKRKALICSDRGRQSIGPVRDCLLDRGYEAVVKVTFRAMLNYLKSNDPNVAIVYNEIENPNPFLAFGQIIREVRAIKDIPLVFLTCYVCNPVDLESAAEGFGYKRLAVLREPIDQRSLEEALKSLKLF